MIVASDQVSALIGVAISAALLPPITNSGLALCIGIVLYVQNEDMVWVEKYIEIGGVSMVLFIMNWYVSVSPCIFCYVVLFFCILAF